MALHPSNNLSANISTLEMMRVIYINEGNYETAQRQLQLFFFFKTAIFEKQLFSKQL